ncbi:MAG TPA: hypothetical protein DFS52_17330, partial [Myxococcales bacterium]|nr:hypothetical protein [Myxococcales bacterium]
GGFVIKSLCGSAADDAWAVGSESGEGVVFHWDGAAWSRFGASLPTRLSGCWASAAGEVWLSGEGGVLLRRVTQ